MFKVMVLYGVHLQYKDVTNVALNYLTYHDDSGKRLFIPKGEETRAYYFGDPLFGILKHILVIISDDNDKNNKKVMVVNHDEEEDFLIDENEKGLLNNKSWKGANFDLMTPEDKLSIIHKNLQIEHGDFTDEYPEQLLVATYVKPCNKVLELGANIGRNSLVIASILEDQNNLVTLEINHRVAVCLYRNMMLNLYKFNIEECALSYRKLMQSDWVTYLYDEDKMNKNNNETTYDEVDIITFEELEKEYDIIFDTIVADCEGALYYILLDRPEILDNINLVIMENDYKELDQYLYVEKTLAIKGLNRIYSKCGGFGPCYNNFYEVWRR